MTDFGLQPHVDTIYQRNPPRLALQANNLAEFGAWQAALRAEVVKLLGLAGRTAPTHPQAEKLDSVDKGDYIEEQYALDVGEGVPAPMYLLVPKSPPPHKAVMVFHGHNPSVQYILGNYPDEQTTAERLAVDNNYAQALAQAGYLVCAVEQRGFGERITEQTRDETNSCRHLSFEYMLNGRTLLGERCWDGMVAISYVQQREDVVPGVLGCTGNSGGGTTTVWLSAIDERITTVVPACCFCSFKHSILGVYHCECNYVPNILQYAEMGDLAALITPRPLRFINGEHDPIFPIAHTHEQFETVRRAYTLHDAEDHVSLAVHPGGHGYHHALAQEWFKKWL